jgi:hypothetical protein
MAGLMRLLLFPCLIVVGWLASRASRERMRRTSRLLLGMLFGVVLLSAISGGFHSGRNVGEFHKWSGHALVILAWLTVPFIVGVVLQQHLRQRPVRSIAQSVALLFFLLLTFLCSFTGYIGPSYDDAVPQLYLEETHRRFVVLHFALLPSMIAVLTVNVWLFLRSRLHPPQSIDRSDDIGNIQTSASSNPYEPPTPLT